MALYLVGLGLDSRSVSVDAFEIVSSCKKVYVDNYTVTFPYDFSVLQEALGVKKVIPLKREAVEDESLVAEAKDKDVALLVYGDALSATTHMQLILACKEKDVHYRVFSNASILTVVAQTGLQPYKFGKVVSMPDWKEHTNKPKSYARAIKENQTISAHTLILTDIGLGLTDAVQQLKDSDINPDKLIVVSKAGTEKQKILFDSPDKLQNEKVDLPFCLIIPGELHFIESDALQAVKDEPES